MMGSKFVDPLFSLFFNLLNKEYNSILKLSLVNLYYNNNIEKYNLTTDNINLFKNYVDNIAQSNNVSSANILFNKIELII